MAGQLRHRFDDNYHELRPSHANSLALKDALIESLTRAPTDPEQEERALAIWQWRLPPGRGLLDMKSGLAVAMPVSNNSRPTRDRQGNLMLVATPTRNAKAGECDRSGMRARSGQGFRHRNRRGINLDVTSIRRGAAKDGPSTARTIASFYPLPW